MKSILCAALAAICLVVPTLSKSRSACLDLDMSDSTAVEECARSEPKIAGKFPAWLRPQDTCYEGQRVLARLRLQAKAAAEGRRLKGGEEDADGVPRPRCTVVAKVVKRLRGQDPAWLGCVDYDGTETHMRTCLAGMAHGRASQFQPAAVARLDCTGIRKLYEFALGRVYNFHYDVNGKGRRLPPGYQEPDCALAEAVASNARDDAAQVQQSSRKVYVGANAVVEPRADVDAKGSTQHKGDAASSDEAQGLQTSVRSNRANDRADEPYLRDIMRSRPYEPVAACNDVRGPIAGSNATIEYMVSEEGGSIACEMERYGHRVLAVTKAQNATAQVVLVRLSNGQFLEIEMVKGALRNGSPMMNLRAARNPLLKHTISLQNTRSRSVLPERGEKHDSHRRGRPDGGYLVRGLTGKLREFTLETITVGPIQPGEIADFGRAEAYIAARKGVLSETDPARILDALSDGEPVFLSSAIVATANGVVGELRDRCGMRGIGRNEANRLDTFLARSAFAPVRGSSGSEIVAGSTRWLTIREASAAIAKNSIACGNQSNKVLLEFDRLIAASLRQVDDSPLAMNCVRYYGNAKQCTCFAEHLTLLGPEYLMQPFTGLVLQKLKTQVGPLYIKAAATCGM